MRISNFFTKSFTLATLLASGVLSAEESGKVTNTVWNNIAGYSVNDLTSNERFYNSSADSTELRTSLSVNPALNQTNAQRVRGRIVAPVTGTYRFWLTGDDSAQFALSPNASKWDRKVLLDLAGARTRQDWDNGIYSAEVPLVEGQEYFFELLEKNGVGLGHADVAWSYLDSSYKNWARDPAAVASQSTNYSNGSLAEKAIDGNEEGDLAKGSVTHTDTTSAANWWQVDFGTERPVQHIVLWNRSGGASPRLSNFRVSVLSAAGVVLASKDFHTASGAVGTQETWELTTPVNGKVVKIETLGTNRKGDTCLSLAEVQVFGSPVANAKSALRQIVSGAHLKNYTADATDADLDELRDAWELQYGFDITKSQTGSFSPFSDPDKDALSNVEESRRQTSPLSGTSTEHFWTYEKWSPINAYGVEDLVMHDRFFQAPDMRLLVNLGQATNLSAVYSGSRLRSYITAPESGMYRFWISVRDGGQLWLSTDETKYRKKYLCGLGPSLGTGHGIWKNAGNLWDVFSSQMSEEVYLEAGKKYFCEALNQDGHVSRTHVDIAWARPGKQREALPLAFVSSYGFTDADADDDYLPDSWETQYGLSATDNGGADRAREGEHGDFDHDGLSNRLEYVYGSQPNNSDSDGDGILDGEEVHSYGSNPSVSDAPSETLVSTVPLESYTGSNGSWTLSSEGLIGSTFRGGIEWGFTVPSAGHYTLHIKTKLLGNLFFNEEVPASVSVDGTQIWKSKIVYGQQREALVRVTTPYLAAGAHSLRLFIDNVIARRTVSIQSFKVFRPDGVDSNGDGKPDWIESQLKGANKVFAYQSASATSPAFLEGSTRILSQTRLNNQAVKASANSNGWYANLPLKLDGTPTSFTSNFESGIVDVGQISWKATNILSNTSVIIRKGDALRFVAHPGGASTGQAATLRIPETNWSLTDGAVATQSSSYSAETAANRAIDGNTDGSYYNGSLTHTQNLAGGWWQVDLGADKAIDKIVLWNRTDCCLARLSNYKVSIINALGTVVATKDFHTSGGTHSGVSETWQLSAPVTGKRVKIQSLGANKEGNHILSLAEVEIIRLAHDHPLASDSDFLALRFNKAGTHSISATHSNGATGTMNVTVKQANFSQTPQDLLSNSVNHIVLQKRKIDSDLSFDAGDQGAVTTTTQQGENFTLKFNSQHSGALKLAARLYKNGPILGTKNFNLIVVSDALQNGLQSTELSNEFQGFRVLTTPLVVTNLPPGGKIKVTVWRAGVTFLDGTKVKWVKSADFINGTVSLEFLFPIGLDGGYCHYIDAYDSHGNHLGQRY